jgi:hypothetical protein
MAAISAPDSTADGPRLCVPGRESGLSGDGGALPSDTGASALCGVPECDPAGVTIVGGGGGGGGSTLEGVSGVAGRRTKRVPDELLPVVRSRLHAQLLVARNSQRCARELVRTTSHVRQ